MSATCPTSTTTPAIVSDASTWHTKAWRLVASLTVSTALLQAATAPADERGSTQAPMLSQEDAALAQQLEAAFQMPRPCGRDGSWKRQRSVIRGIAATMEALVLTPLEKLLVRQLGKSRQKCAAVAAQLDGCHAILAHIHAMSAEGEGAGVASLEDQKHGVAGDVVAASQPAVQQMRFSLPPSMAGNKRNREAPLTPCDAGDDRRAAVATQNGDDDPLKRRIAAVEAAVSPVSALVHGTSDADTAMTRRAVEPAVAFASVIPSVTTTNAYVHPVARSCDLCDDATGDLAECQQCKAWLHEGCGGVHPDDLIAVCYACRRSMGFGSEESELNSQTSSDEKCSTETDDTSLSGFIVRSGEESEMSGASSTSEDDDMRVLRGRKPTKRASTPSHKARRVRQRISTPKQKQRNTPRTPRGGGAVQRATTSIMGHKKAAVVTAPQAKKRNQAKNGSRP